MLPKIRSPKIKATLRSTLNRVMLLTLGVAIILAVGAIISYARIKQNFTERTLVESLTQNSPAQVEALLPSLLVPEQRSGANIFLERFRESEKLDGIELLPAEAAIPAGLISCSPVDGGRICFNPGKTQITALIRIREAGRNFGLLLKTKRVPNSLANDHLLQIIEFTTGALFLAFLLLFIFLTRVTAYE